MHYSEWSEERKEKSREASRRWNAQNKDYRNAYHRKYEASRTNESRLLRSSKPRAIEEGVPHTISVEDIIINDNCPVCELPMSRSNIRGGTARSPTLDKVRPELGYVPGNVAVICKYCNSAKGSASAELHRRIADYIDSF